MVAVAMTRYHQKWYITRVKDLLKVRISGRILLPLVCMTNAFCESANNNSVTSLELTSFSSSQRTSSCTIFTRLLGSRLITLMAPGFMRHLGG